MVSWDYVVRGRARSWPLYLQCHNLSCFPAGQTDTVHPRNSPVCWILIKVLQHEDCLEFPAVETRPWKDIACRSYSLGFDSNMLQQACPYPWKSPAGPGEPLGRGGRGCRGRLAAPSGPLQKCTEYWPEEQVVHDGVEITVRKVIHTEDYRLRLISLKVSSMPGWAGLGRAGLG